MIVSSYNVWLAITIQKCSMVLDKTVGIWNIVAMVLDKSLASYMEYTVYIYIYIYRSSEIIRC